MEQKDVIAHSIKTKMWLDSVFVALLLFIFSSFYIYLYRGSLTLLVLSQSVAATAALMIGSSFAVSGIGFYFDFLDTKNSLS